MKLTGRVLTGSTQTVTTKKGTQLQKTRIKFQDVGDEVQGDLIAYWVDFLGESAISEGDVAVLMHEVVEIDIKRITTSKGKDGGVFLNVTGGIIRHQGKNFQAEVKR